MAKKSKGVGSNQAALIHELLGEVFETSLRQQLLSGEFNAAMIGRVVDWLKHNNVTCVEDADEHLSNLAKAFRGASIEDILGDIPTREI